MTTPQKQQFSLKWNNFSQHIVTAFEDLRGDNEFTDVTLSCEGKRLNCHKVLLSACSVYFKETFRENPCKHPVIILKGVEYLDLQAVVTFMYNGQVNVSQERLSTFLQTAELLQIKGLTEMNDREETPTVKKRCHVNSAGPAELGANLPHSLKSDNGSIITPEIKLEKGETTQEKVETKVEKGETFVYTNEDLGMTMDADTDNNESGEDEPEVSLAGAKNSGPKLEGNSQDAKFHEVSGSCPWCMQVFTSLPLLQRHMKNHMTGPHKPFACHYCNSTFARSAHLKRHLRTHTGEKPYQCSVCQRQFARQDKLKIHLERHLQNSAKTTNNSLTITSYPPPSMSQNAVNQVPIKILIPTGGSNSSSSQNPNYYFPNGHRKNLANTNVTT